MAFVYRTQRQSLFDPPPRPQPYHKIQPQRTISHAPMPTKGLPCQQYIKSQQSQQSKENMMPRCEGNPIHQNDHINKRMLFLNKASKYRSTEERSPCLEERSPCLRGVLRINQNSCRDQQKNTFIAFTQKIIKTKPKKYQEKQQHKGRVIVNKDLVKTIQNLKKTSSIQEQFSTDHFNQNQSISKNLGSKQKQWRSVKKIKKELSRLPTNDNSLSLLNQTLITAKKQHKSSPKVLLTKLISKQQKQSEDEQEQEEYINEATPGPGSYYHQRFDKKKQFRSKRQKFQKIFYSQIQRFTVPQQHQEPMQPKQTEQGIHKEQPCQSFLSKCPKFPIQHQKDVPPLGYYNTRQGLQHDLVRHILKSSNSKTFIANGKKGLLFTSKGEMPGPGSYQLDRSCQKLAEERNQLNYTYKSSLKRSIQSNQFKSKNYSNPNVLDCIKVIQKGSPIHVKDDVLQGLILSQPPPFLSASQRFPPIKLDLRSIKIPKNTQILPRLPYKQPFSVLAGRDDSSSLIGEGVGVGLYNTGLDDKWTKKSFNRLYN